jgi:hypothetical protein
LGFVYAEVPPTQRTIQVQVNQLQLHFQANSQNETHQDQLQFNIDLGESHLGLSDAQDNKTKAFCKHFSNTRAKDLKTRPNSVRRYPCSYPPELMIVVAEFYEINDTFYQGEPSSLVSVSVTSLLS